MDPNTIAKQLFYITVRIVADTADPAKKSVGTGFFINYALNKSGQIYLVTNKHVVAKIDDVTGKVVGKIDNAHFEFIKGENGKPKLGETIKIQIPNLTDSFKLHPDTAVDIAICNISPILNHITNVMKKEVFIRALPADMIPTSFDIFDAIEDVLFVGYPNGIYDQKNNLPIIRKGITASPVSVNFNGQNEFLIDAQVYPGSSGSPVIIKEQSLRGGKLTLGPEKHHLVGLISKVHQRDEHGVITQTPAPTMLSFSFSVKEKIGLGICEKANQIIDLIQMVNSGTV